MTDAQIDKILKPYFDTEFEGSEYTRKFYGQFKEEWIGFFKNTSRGLELLVGYPADEGDFIWYCNDISETVSNILNIGDKEARDSIIRYVKNKFNIKIRHIF